MFASIVGQFGHPLYVAFAWILAGTFALIPNSAAAIAIMTLAVMIVLYPITLRSSRPHEDACPGTDIERLRARFKTQPGMTASERRECQLRQHTALKALYEKNGISLVRTHLPLLVQLPILIALNGTIRAWSINQWWEACSRLIRCI